MHVTHHILLEYTTEYEKKFTIAQEGSQCVCVTPDGKDMCANT